MARGRGFAYIRYQNEHTYVAMVCDVAVERATGKLLGLHIAGEDAPEIIQLAAVAVKAGLTKAQWDSTLALHPTAAEELVLMREPIPTKGT